MPAMDYKTVCDADEPITVKVEAPDLCPRYMARYVRNIRMGESPRWMLASARSSSARSWRWKSRKART